VPKAAVNEQGCIKFLKDEIWFPRQLLHIQSVSETKSVKSLSYEQLRAGVPATDS
jgi:hypothetical protein